MYIWVNPNKAKEIDKNENYKVDISLISYNDFSVDYKIVDNGSSSGVFDVNDPIIGIAVYAINNTTNSDLPEQYYYLEFNANYNIITKFNFDCPYMFYSSDNMKYFYEYPTSFNLYPNSPQVDYDPIASIPGTVPPPPPAPYCGAVSAPPPPGLPCGGLTGGVFPVPPAVTI